ncbi:MAG: DUF4070 domain-containing protein [Deltaproteobacteria bacterium]|nr:DUF4070 domain-containing protein [Deltaproteobacteria bacterium]
MKALLVYPRYPDTFWSFRHALGFTSKKALSNPLGLLTVAALLPAEWEKRAVDMNVSALDPQDIVWSDLVFVSAMVAQQTSAREVIELCRRLDRKVVAGGPLFTSAWQQLGFDAVDHLLLNEAELTLPRFLADLDRGCPGHLYRTAERADITRTPAPLFSLLDMTQYAMASVQYSRGCPYDCEFCDIVVLDGRRPRTKTGPQMIAELEALRGAGFMRGSVFIVDDNFIGNRHLLKAEILPAIAAWNREHGYPYRFATQTSINVVDDEELTRLMSDAGFGQLFIGIESPAAASLAECNKLNNRGRDQVAAVKLLQRRGFEVMGGFIVGFDSDDPAHIFEQQIDFIEQSGIVTAMVGMLTAAPETRLWRRLEQEDRLLPRGSGDNTDGTTNLVPRMGIRTLLAGYQRILRTIYSPHSYYRRIHTFLEEYRPNPELGIGFRRQGYRLLDFFRCALVLGLRDRARGQFWKTIGSALCRRPGLVGIAVQLAAQGYHLRQVSDRIQRLQIEEQPLPSRPGSRRASRPESAAPAPTAITG